MTTYKIRRFKNGENKSGEAFINYSLTVPTKIAEKIADDMKFTCELTDEGLLFRPAEKEENKLPAWARSRVGSRNGHK